MRKALVVDDHPIVRATVKMVLQQESFTQIVEAADGADAVQQAREVRPDLVVLDISMPKLDGLEAIRRIVDLDVGARILVLTSLEASLYLQRCMQAGAAGYLSKNRRFERPSSCDTSSDVWLHPFPEPTH